MSNVFALATPPSVGGYFIAAYEWLKAEAKGGALDCDTANRILTQTLAAVSRLLAGLDYTCALDSSSGPNSVAWQAPETPRSLSIQRTLNQVWTEVQRPQQDFAAQPKHPRARQSFT